MFTDLITASKALLGAAGLLRQLQKDKAKKLADVFERLSALLAEIVQRKATGDSFVDLCSELTVYADDIEALGQGVATQEKLHEISAALERAMASRALLHAAHNPESDAYSEQVNSLLEASGTFRALALMTKPAE